MSTHRLTGTIAAAVTPLKDGGRQLDEEALAAVLRFYADSGLDGVLMLGTTGEGVLFGGQERRRVAELALELAGELPVLVHCGAQSTADTAALAQHAAEVGAAGVAVIAPPYFAFTARELLEHLAAAAAACAPLPFYVYEYAERSGYAIPIEVIAALRERAANLAGMKVSDSPFERVSPYLLDGLDVFIGAEPVLPEGLAAGAVGAVSGVAAAFPEAVSALVREPTAAHAAVVGELRDTLASLPFQAAVKAALGLRGLPVRADVRAPLLALERSQIEALRERLQAAVGSLATAAAA